MEDCCTLKSFLKKNERELLDNLYTITFSGKITFDQNLFYSKITDYIKLSKRVDQLIRDEECIEDLTGQFVIFTKEFQNAVLTSDLLKTIRAVCTDQELNEIMGCKVITACYYKKSDLIENPRDWVEYMETVLKKDDYIYDFQRQSIVDKRSRKWTSIKLEGLFGPIIEQRKALKREIKPAIERGEPSEFVDQLKAKQEVLKLIGNTIYGVVSHFSMSEIVSWLIILLRKQEMGFG